MDYRNTGADGLKEGVNAGEGAPALPASIPCRDGRTSPANLRVCARGRWPQRIRVETTFSLLTRVCRSKRATHRAWPAFQMHPVFAVAVQPVAPAPVVL